MQVERLEIPITGNFGEVKLCVYPASGNAMLFEEEDAVDYGELSKAEVVHLLWDLLTIYHDDFTLRVDCMKNKIKIV